MNFDKCIHQWNHYHKTDNISITPQEGKHLLLKAIPCVHPGATLGGPSQGTVEGNLFCRSSSNVSSNYTLKKMIQCYILLHFM